MSSTAVKQNARSFQLKMQKLAERPADGDEAPAEVSFTTDEIQAALVESASQPSETSTSPATAADGTATQLPSGQQLSLAQAPPVVTFENDIVRGQFQAALAGQPVTVTVAGHLGAEDGYATFEPTEFKIGDMSVPVSLVNDQLHKKMMEQRDRLKLPDNIANLRIENGQLVVQRK